MNGPPGDSSELELNRAEREPRTQGRSTRRWLFALGILLVSVGVIIQNARVDRAWSDPRATLLVAQALLQTGDIKLDFLSAKDVKRYGPAVAPKNGHLYGYFPLGSSILAVPVVAVMNRFGLDVRDTDTDARGQHYLVLGISLATLVLLVLLARTYLSPPWALFSAALFWSGTSLASTGATALWSHDFATLFALLSIYLCLRPDRGKRAPGLILGAALFLAYFCRPTLALLAPTIFGYLWLSRRHWLLPCAGALAIGLGSFVGFSWFEYRQILPDYYLPERLSNPEFLTALWANLVSPSRGSLVFSPLLALPLLFVRSAKRALRTAPALALIAVAWPLVHLVVISRFPHWWAGFSFGPRLWTDVLPGCFLLLVITLRQALATSKWLCLAALSALALPSVLINTYQGLYNIATVDWLNPPNLDQNPQLLFDWRYPQFLATTARNERRLEEFKQAHPATPRARPPSRKQKKRRRLHKH